MMVARTWREKGGVGEHLRPIGLDNIKDLRGSLSDPGRAVDAHTYRDVSSKCYCLDTPDCLDTSITLNNHIED